jgi:PAS domain S-box-containing protein
MDFALLTDSTPNLPTADAAWWPWVTIGLIALAAAGYAAVAVNWYCLSRLSRGEAATATWRLCLIVGCCATCGWAFYVAELGWVAWRAYDGLLLLLVGHTWASAVRMRGLGLVDERLAQVAELERTADRYREIAELLPDVVWTADREGRVEFANLQWVEYAGDGCMWTDAVHPEEQAEVALWWGRATRGRERVAREVRLRGRDGGYRTFVVRATPVVHGDHVKWLGACADVEDQRRLAAEREAAARQKAFFLNALSHDLRAPLHNVVLNAHLLKMTVRDPADVDCVNMIVENAAAAGDLVTRLLEFAKAGEDRDLPARTPVDDVLQSVVRRFQPAAEQKGLHLRLAADAADAAAEVWADRQKLERILSNLVDNALKFTVRGGVDLEYVTTTRPTGASATAACEEVWVRVRDSGIGIPNSSVPLLFDEFYQVENHERDRTKGFGIGLAICRSLARQLGGDVRLVDTGPRGSCFEVVVPAAVRAGRGGRPDGEARDRRDPETAGLCRL